MPVLPLPTPVRVNNLKPLLSDYDFDKSQFLIKGFTYGFRIFSDIEDITF